ncbi:MAG: hypothetical protein ACHBNF_14450 [Chromatiales bacterium]
MQIHRGVVEQLDNGRIDVPELIGFGRADAEFWFGRVDPPSWPSTASVQARTVGTIIQTAALRNALPAVVSSGAEVQDAQRTTQGYHALRPLDSAQECGLGVALWQAFFIQSYSKRKRTQQGDQKTDHCAEFANLLSQLEVFGLQSDLAQFEDFDGHDRTPTARPPSVGG